MKVKDMMGKVMVALDEVTSFDLVANLEDYRFKIYEAMDSTQRELATMASPIVETKEIIVEEGAFIFPEDLYELITIMKEDYSPASFDYIRPDILRIDNGKYYVMYNRYPKILTATQGTAEEIGEIELEISKEAQEAMIYGTCALLCINDEPDLYNTYMSRYTAYMTNIINRKEQKPKAVVRGGVAI